VVTTAPVGPVNIMVIQKSVHQGFWQGLAVGLGAVAADLFFAVVAVFGVSAIMTYIEGQAAFIQAVGGCLLIGFGLRIRYLHSSTADYVDTGSRGLSDSIAAFFMTLTNPGTILGFAAIFGGLGNWGPQHGNTPGKLFLLAGVALGATAWWAFVALVVSTHRQRFTARMLDLTNQIAAIVLVGFGVLVLGRLIYRLWPWAA